MTVKELIAILQSKPQDLQVAYSRYSEFCLLEESDIQIESMCEPRPDGWIHARRPDKSTQDYLVLS